MAISFYTDEHIAAAAVHGLRLRGVDVISAKDAELLGAPDEKHIVFAREHGRVIITQDADFLRLHAAGIPHAGIVYAAQGTAVGTIVRTLLFIHHVLDAKAMENHVEFV